MTEAKTDSLLSDIGHELASHPHSVIRGLSSSAGMAGALYSMEQMGALNPQYPETAGALYVLAAATGVVIGMSHANKEEGISLVKQHHPGKFFRNLYNTVSQGAMTAVHAAAGFLGVSSVAIGEMAHETAQSIGVDERHMQLGMVAGVTMPALTLISKFVENFSSSGNSLEAKMARNQRALKNNLP